MENRRGSIWGGRVYAAFIHIVVVALAIEVVILAGQNSALKNPARAMGTPLQVGDSFFFKGLEAVAGNSSADSSVRTLVFVLSADCPFCRLNYDRWDSIASDAYTASVRVVGIAIDSLDRLRSDTAYSQLLYPLYWTIDKSQFIQINKLHSVPQTILVSRKGIVESIWVGVLQDSSIVALRSALSTGKGH